MLNRPTNTTRYCVGLLFMSLIMHSCCKIYYQYTILKVKFEGYTFTDTDSIKIAHFADPGATILRYQKNYKVDENGEISIEIGGTPYKAVIISNPRLLIADTLTNLKTAEETISSGCPTVNHYTVSFENRGLTYGPDISIELLIKR